jgi:O-antigen/teichoic acid export membrane protein
MTDELAKVAEDSARGGFFLISGTALATVIMAIASILVGRLLGAELYGQYTLALVVPQLLLLFTDLGINQGIIKFAASLRAKEETNRITKMIQSGILFRAIIGTAIFAVNFAFADLFAALINRPNIAPYMQIASVWIIFQVIYTTATSAFVGLDKTEYTALMTNIHATVKTTLSVLLVVLGFSVTGAIIGHVASSIIASITGASILFFKLLKPSKKSNDDGFTQNLKILTSYGLPLYISVLLAGFLPLYQNLILAYFATDIAVGNYKAATNFISLITILSLSITTALLPAFSKLNSSTTEKIKAFFKLANKYTCLLIVPTTTLIIIYSKEIVQIIYGSTFQSASIFLAIYCVLFFLVAIGYLNLGSMFNGLGETRITLKTTLINFSIFLVIAPILTKIYSVPGLIIAFIISSTIATTYALHIARTKFKIEFDTQSTIKIYSVAAISTIPSLLLLHFTPLPELFKVIAGGFLYLFIYATLTPLTGIVSAPELQTVTRITQDIRPLTLIAKPILSYEQKILRIRAKTVLATE